MHHSRGRTHPIYIVFFKQSKICCKATWLFWGKNLIGCLFWSIILSPLCAIIYLIFLHHSKMLFNTYVQKVLKLCFYNFLDSFTYSTFYSSKYSPFLVDIWYHQLWIWQQWSSESEVSFNRNAEMSEIHRRTINDLKL